MLSVGAFDIDGTILHHTGNPDYLDAESLAKAKSDYPVCKRIATLIEAGVEIHFITGRSHAVRVLTIQQLRNEVHPGIRSDQVHTQGKFEGYDQMAHFKANVLKSIKAEWYVGDHEADKKAAMMAGVVFQDAETYSKVSRGEIHVG